ncbi:MAG: STAS domain-containing protein [Actinomycetota bacterium]|nr:STAS domain-containing protein [Actinomycetota bacterium]
MNLHLSTESVGDRRVLGVQGEVDVYSAPSLRDRLKSLIDSSQPDLIVDLSGIAFIDSTGLGVLVGGQNRAQESGGVLRVVCPQERILKLFRITGLDEVFSIYPTVPEAISAA